MNQKRDPGRPPKQNLFLRGESDSNLYAFKPSTGQPCDKACRAWSHRALLSPADVLKRDGATHPPQL